MVEFEVIHNLKTLRAKCAVLSVVRYGEVLSPTPGIDGVAIQQAQVLAKRFRVAGRFSWTGCVDFLRLQLLSALANGLAGIAIQHEKQQELDHEGQHPAIIDPSVWDKVQDLLQSGAAAARGSRRKATRSPLASKLFDETGDCLTPSHRRKNGKQLRYYISRRLVKDRSRKHPDAWRQPADQVEGLQAELVGQHLTRPGAAIAMTEGLTAAELNGVSKRLQEQGNVTERLALIERADLRPGSLAVRLDTEKLANRLDCLPEQINLAELTIAAPFQMRRRGVELKLHLGEPPAEIDSTLVQNIMKGRSWLAMVIAGKTFSEIAGIEGVSKRRVQDVTNLAMLAPDVLDRIAAGEQPDGLTTDYLIKTRFPAVWSEQREQFASL
ncbi:MAG: hypothetical protein ACRBBS_14340 [Thalassovita sp.]